MTCSGDCCRGSSDRDRAEIAAGESAAVDPAERCGCRGREAQMEGFAIPCLLLLLLEKPAHGYDLIDRLGTEFGLGGVDPGGVYRNLRRMEDEGFLRSTWETGGPGPARKVYSVTREGEELLAVWATSVARNRRVLDSFLARYEAYAASGDRPDPAAGGAGGRQTSGGGTEDV
ncbi:MAG: helix-turn-helix transcriptional regulator [Bacillota bacterium]|jgi:poly-beta-hydroxybutyrate-responsive repressor